MTEWPEPDNGNQPVPGGPEDGAAPAVLVEPGSYSCSNVGDVAMLQVAVARLVSLWPGARVRVFTTHAATLTDHCPRVRPVEILGRAAWLDDRYLVGRERPWIPAFISQAVIQMSRTARRRVPQAVSAIFQGRAYLGGEAATARAIREFADLWLRTDLVLLAGQASLTDHAQEHAMTNLAFLEAGIERGIPTAMLGQGIGPLRDPELHARARAVLPRVDVIGVRERCAGPALLEELGVNPARVVVTGDDAIELARSARRAEVGDAIGVNLRVAGYAAVDGSDLAMIRPVLHDFARPRGARLLPVPIAHGRVAQDPRHIRELLRGFDDQSDGGEKLDTPAQVIQQITQCRVVVTGAYHAAVFALSLGVPVVCLARSQYYIDKFVGLADMFGAGCFLVRLDQADVPARLTAALHEAWAEADGLRAPLRQAADRQCAWGQVAYGRLASLVGGYAAAKLTAANTASPGVIHNSEPVSEARPYPILL